MTTLMRVDEVAEQLRLSPSAVYRRVEAGELGAVWLGKGPRAPVRVPADEFERYLAKATRKEKP